MADTTTDRRQHDRTEVALDATVERVAGRPLAGPASTIDVSEGGARLLGPVALTVGDVVRVSIRRGDLTVERQALIVGRQSAPGSPDQAMLNVAFKTPGYTDTGDLRRIIELGSTP